MTVGTSAAQGRGLLTTALMQVERWLLEPADGHADVASDPQPRAAALRRVTAVFGLAPHCGTTTVARALAIEHARRDPAHAAAVSCEEGSLAIPLATAPAIRLARTLGRPAEGQVRAVGRLCLLRSTDHLWLVDALAGIAPLVLDAGHSRSPAAAASLADNVVLVASPQVEPALAAVVAASLARVGPEPVTVVNRATDAGRWDGRPVVLLPASRAEARLALAGREPRRAFGAAIAGLAELCEQRSRRA